MPIDNVSFRWVLGLMAGVPLLVAVCALGALAWDADQTRRGAAERTADLQTLGVVAEMNARVQAEDWLFTLARDLPAPAGQDVNGQLRQLLADALTRETDAAIEAVEALELTAEERTTFEALLQVLDRRRSRGLGAPDGRHGPDMGEELRTDTGEAAPPLPAWAASAPGADEDAHRPEPGGVRALADEFMGEVLGGRVHANDGRWLGITELHAAYALAAMERPGLAYRLAAGHGPTNAGPQPVLAANDATARTLGEAEVWLDGLDVTMPDRESPWREVIRRATRVGGNPFGEQADDYTELLDAGAVHLASVADVIDEVAAQIEAANAEQARSAQWREALTVLLLAVFGGSAATAVWLVSARLTSRVQRVLQSATAIAEGDLDPAEQPDQGADEIGQLARAVGAIGTSLGLVHTQIAAISDVSVNPPLLPDTSGGGLGQRMRDAVQAVNATAAQLTQMAIRDPLTGTLNRQGLAARFDAHGDGGGALLVLDVDHLAPINDQHGHLVGDIVLRCTADRLAGAMPQDGVVARVGGDEFAVLLSDASHASRAADVAAKLCDEVARPVTAETPAGPVTVAVGCTVGWHEFGDHETLDTIMAAATASMRRHVQSDRVSAGLEETAEG